MLFTDIPAFWLFLGFVVVLSRLSLRFYALNRIVLILCSLIFFALYSLKDTALFLCVVSLNYAILCMSRNTPDARGRAMWMATIVCSDILVLLYFKYYGFVTVEVFGLSSLAKLGPAGELAPYSLFHFTGVADHVWAPLALSFYIFHLISYSVDVQKGKYPLAGPVNFLLYVSFFPHLIAGPIVRGNELIPQFHVRNRAIDWSGGLYYYALGLFFKIAIADGIASVIDPFWSANAAPFSTIEHWAVAILYSCQIYADFGGYSMMAIGIARLLGYELPENFRAPYIAATFSDFWRRWHITLSRFLRDYLYIQLLSGSRRGRLREHTNIMLTMLLGGLWHGAGWHFAAWGGMHGCALSIERLLGMRADKLPFLVTLAWFLVVQLTVVMTWIMFRSPDVSSALAFFKSMFLPMGEEGGLRPELRGVLILVLPVLLQHVAWVLPPKITDRVETPFWRGLLVGVLTVLSVVADAGPKGFIYFNF